MHRIHVGLMMLVLAILPACTTAQPGADPRAPNAFVAAADPRAVDAGLEVLARGGTAIDAAIAVQAVLGLVEPQSSGLGGGAFALYWNAAERKLHAFDGREIAPASATPELFLDAEGKPLSFFEAVPGGKSVGVPGVVAMMDMMHRRHGALAWSTLFGEAERLASDGFAIGPRLAYVIRRWPLTDKMPDTRAYFMDAGGKPLPEGHILKNEAYADTVRLLAREGAQAFYSGAMAQAISDAVTNAPKNPTILTVEDIAAYEPKEREPLCQPYRTWSVCGMPPPTSGGTAVAQVLGQLEGFEMGALRPNSAAAVHLIAESMKLAYADRAEFLGDPDVVDVPLRGLTHADYLAARARLIDSRTAMDTARPGNPWPYEGRAPEPRAPDTTPDLPGTSHFTIVDPDGNVLSMTTTIESAFGSHIMVNGFLLNNELTDFSFVPRKDGKLVANAVGPRKRPRSSMSPTIVFRDDGTVDLAIGSPGGSSIPLYVLKTLIAALDWDMNLDDAVNLPNFGSRNRGRVLIEEGTELAAIKAELEAMGHTVVESNMTSGLYGVRLREDGFEGGSDRRRDGTAKAVYIAR